MRLFTSLLLITLSTLSLAKPTIPTSYIKVFANRVAISMYDYDYQNYQQKLKQTAKLFTSAGWKKYIIALTQSKLNDSVIKNKYTVSAVATSPAKIVGNAFDKKIPLWKVELPLMVVFKNNQYQQVQYLALTLIIEYTSSGFKARDVISKKGKPLKCEKTSDGLIYTGDS